MRHLARTAGRLMLVASLSVASCREPEVTAPLVPVKAQRARVVQPLTPADYNPFGITVGNPGGQDLTGPQLLDSLAASNVGWLRMGTGWSWVEPGGNWDFETSEASGDISRLITALQWARDNGQKAYMQIHSYPPDWARGGASVPHQYGPSCANANEAFTRWAEFVERVVDTFDSLGVRHYAIHNEPADTGQFRSQYCYGPHWIDDYEELTRRAAQVIHAKNPANKVIYWEQGSWHQVSLIPLLQQSLARLGSDVDIVAVHAYAHAAANQTFVQAAGGVWNQMTIDFAPIDKELWLTEFGGNELGYVAGQNRWYTPMDQRDNVARVLLQFLQPSRPAKWTKIFPFTGLDDSTYGLTSGVATNDPSRFTMSYAMWGYNFIANRWGWGYPLYYEAYQYDFGQWYAGGDGTDAPPSDPMFINATQGLWGARFVFPQALRNANVAVCAQYHFGFIGWLNNNSYGYCDGQAVGPIEFGGQNHQLEAFKLYMINPLPTASGGRMTLCGAAKPKNLNWITSCTPATVSGGLTGTIGTTTQAKPLVQLKAYLTGAVP